MKIDWRRKLTSRKLWIALAGFIAGLIDTGLCASILSPFSIQLFTPSKSLFSVQVIILGTEEDITFFNYANCIKTRYALLAKQ